MSRFFYSLIYKGNFDLRTETTELIISMFNSKKKNYKQNKLKYNKA